MSERCVPTREEKEFFWKSHLEHVLRPAPTPAQEDDGQNVPPVYELQVNPPPDVPMADALLPCLELPFDFIVSERMRLLAVDLDVTDADIMDAFKEWLRTVRERFPKPLRHYKGPPSLDETYYSKHGKTWHERLILAVLDLDLWCAIFNKKKATQAELGSWLAPTYDKDPANWDRRARKVLQQALNSIDALRNPKSG